MKDLLVYMLSNIVDYPEEIRVEEEVEADGTITFKVLVHPDDVGKVIGRKGKIINSMRNIVRVKAIKEDKRARVEVINPPKDEAQEKPDEPKTPKSEPKQDTKPEVEAKKATSVDKKEGVIKPSESEPKSEPEIESEE